VASTSKRRSLPSLPTSSATAAKPVHAGEAEIIASPRALSDALASSLESLKAAASGDSLCTVRGEKVQATKYFEARVVALRQLDKAASATPGNTTWSLGDLVSPLANQWRREVGAKADADPGWQSYLAGALDVFEEFSSR